MVGVAEDFLHALAEDFLRALAEDFLRAWRRITSRFDRHRRGGAFPHDRLDRLGGVLTHGHGRKLGSRILASNLVARGLFRPCHG